MLSKRTVSFKLPVHKEEKMKKRALIGIFILFFATFTLQAQTVSFHYKAPQINSTSIQSSDMKLTVSMQVKMNDVLTRTMNMQSGETEKKKEIVLAASDQAVTKIKVTYETAEKVTVEDNNEKRTKKNPCAGKTYIVEAQDGTPGVTYLDGTVPPANELKFVRRDYRNIGRKDEITGVISGKTLRTGERFPELEKTMKDTIFGAAEEMESRKFVVLFRGKRRCGRFECGVFEIDMIMAKKNETLEMEISLKGEMLLIVDSSWPVSIILKGPAVLNGAATKNGNKMEISGSGAMNISMDFDYPDNGPVDVPPPPPDR